MKLDRAFLTSPSGHALLILALLVIGVLLVRWKSDRRPALPPAATVPSFLIPRTFKREGTRLPNRSTPADDSGPIGRRNAPGRSAGPPALPLTLFANLSAPPALPPGISAPYGRLIPCETITAIESNHLDTPVIGLVTDDVWHNGHLVIPAGAEVHGKAALDRTRERLAVQGQWHIVWRTPDSENGEELTVDGLALDREHRADAGTFGEHDGSAGLRGQIVKTQDDRELKLFAATFLSTATAALQDTRTTVGPLGELTAAAATVRNAALAGTSSILREYAQTLREAIARDGFYLRVPAGKPFYLYVHQPLSRKPPAPLTP